MTSRNQVNKNQCRWHLWRSGWKLRNIAAWLFLKADGKFMWNWQWYQTVVSSHWKPCVPPVQSSPRPSHPPINISVSVLAKPKQQGPVAFSTAWHFLRAFWFCQACNSVITWPSLKAGQVLKCRQFFYFLGGRDGDSLDLFTWPFQDILGRLTRSTAHCHRQREQNVYMCAFIASVAFFS